MNWEQNLGRTLTFRKTSRDHRFKKIVFLLLHTCKYVCSCVLPKEPSFFTHIEYIQVNSDTVYMYYKVYVHFFNLTFLLIRSSSSIKICLRWIAKLFHRKSLCTTICKCYRKLRNIFLHPLEEHSTNKNMKNNVTVVALFFPQFLAVFK